jgi:N-hydroxyarylamine O-acetyltransferase
MLGGRVLWGRSADAITQRTHMLLLVTIDGKDYITDVGFGGNVYTVPLLLKTDVVQETPLEPYRLMRPEKDYYLLEEQIHDEWKVLYRFTLQKQFLIDYKVANWYTSTHPDSHFVNDLIAARTDKGCRYIVHNNKLVIHHLNKESEHQPLANADEIREALEDVIGLKPPEADNLTPTLESFCTPAATG